MTLTDKTPPGQSESIAFELDLQHAPEKVWRALTDPELLAQWLLPVVSLELAPEGALTLQAPPKAGWDGAVQCRFLEIEAHRKLSYTWVVGDPDSDFFLDTVVTFSLTPTESGTRLAVVQSGFKPEQTQNFAGARYGWKTMGGRLAELLENIS